MGFANLVLAPPPFRPPMFETEGSPANGMRFLDISSRRHRGGVKMP